MPVTIDEIKMIDDLLYENTALRDVIKAMATEFGNIKAIKVMRDSFHKDSPYHDLRIVQALVSLAIGDEVKVRIDSGPIF